MSVALIDIRRIVERAGLRRFLEETARFYESALVINDSEGRVLFRWNEPDEGLPDPAAGLEVMVNDSTMGYVSAAAHRCRDAAAAMALAEHVADLLGEFALKEFELNDLSQEILDSYEEVNLFYDISGALGAVRDVEGVCSVILDKACEIIRVSRASILLLDEASGELRIAAARGIPEEERAGVRIAAGEGISGRVLESRIPQLVDDVRRLPSGLLRGYEQYATRSFISVPLCVDRTESSAGARGSGGGGSDQHRAIGVINMTDRVDRANFSSGDLKLLSALASQAAVLIENNRLIGYEKELKIARNIQQSLLPGAPPVVPGIDLAGRCLPARNVGGDYYDFLLRDVSGHLAVTIADVSGHNVASAIMMAVVRTALRSELRGGAEPAAVLERLNDLLYEDLTRAELFLSLYCVVYDPATKRLRYAKAGHNPALLYRPTESACRLLDADGILTGVVPGAVYSDEVVTLKEGDTVLLYTDGLVEASSPRGEMFGMDRLARALEDAHGLAAGALIEHLFTEVRAFSGERSQLDDMTAVVLKVTDC